MQLILSNQDCDVLDKTAAWTVASGFGGFKNPEQAKLVMLLALSQGEHIGRAVHDYHVINGKLVLKSESMLSRFQNSGGIIRYTQYTDDAVTVQATHPKGGTLSVTWDVAQARRAGLLGNPVWAKHPRAMLKARAITEAVRALYPACLTGVMTTEEAIEVTATNEPMASSPVPTLPDAGEATSEHDQLLDLFHGLDHAHINAFLRHRGRIADGQTFRDLDPDYASLILAHPDRFIAAINA
jgi:hypothetical protein